MILFNSLGSNYSFGFALRAFLGLLWPSKGANKDLRELLSAEWEKEVILTAKGRDAIESGLKLASIGQGDQVLTQAFSCIAVEQGVERSGAEVVYYDLAENSLHPGIGQVKSAIKVASRAKAIIFQHSLGYPLLERKVVEYCRKQGLIVIHDLAQAYGADIGPNQRLGEQAQMVILSFGRDKILDAVSGGAVLYDEELFRSLPKLKLKTGFISVVRELSYPLLSWLIRHTYCLGLGKALHWLVNELNIFRSPVTSRHQEATLMSSFYAPLVKIRLDELAQQLEHRRKLAHVYLNQLNFIDDKIQSLVDRELVSRGTNLRFPLWVEDPQALTKHLADHNIYLADRWYPQAVSAGRLELESQYQTGSCPHAQELSKHIFNLPTHQSMNLDQALELVAIINQYYQT